MESDKFFAYRLVVIGLFFVFGNKVIAEYRQRMMTKILKWSADDTSRKIDRVWLVIGGLVSVVIGAKTIFGL